MEKKGAWSEQKLYDAFSRPRKALDQIPHDTRSYESPQAETLGVSPCLIPFTE